MKNNKEIKRSVIFLTIIALLSFVTAISGAVFAYFSTGVEGEAQTNEIHSASFPGIQFEVIQDPTFPVGGIVPGWKGVQIFSIQTLGEATNSTKGNYEIDLSHVVDPAFEDDLVYYLYKTETPTTHFITTTPGIFVDNGTEIYREDILTFTGFDKTNDLEKTGPLEGTNNIVIESHTFEGPVKETYYYLIYEFKNLETEQFSQGKTFTTIVSANVIPII